ncbi:MAG TPA: hypothetical protein VMH05_23860 [Bryobacteraceae bacterium]|nr:hypothetical protein [Bryobacteraceae bacterium]
MGEPLKEQPRLENARSEEFEDFYANNVQFEATLWDLRLLFGQTDLAAQKVNQHTGMSLPWPQAKLTAYFMIVNVIAHQATNGNIIIPDFVVPVRPNPSDPALEPMQKKTVEYLGWIYDQFFGTEPYIPPAVAAYDEPAKTEN